MKLSPEVEQGIGGLALDAANVELQMALLVAVALDKDWPFVQELVGTAVSVMRAIDRLIEDCPDGLTDKLGRLGDDARQLRRQRNELIHSVAILALDQGGTAHQVALLNPAKDVLRYPTTEEISSLRQRTQALAARCVRLAEHIASARDGERNSVRV